MTDSPPVLTDNPVATPPERRKLRRQPVFVIVSSLVLFTLFWYFGRRRFFLEHLDGWFPKSDLTPLYPFFYFCVASVFFRTVMPLVCIKLVLKRRARDFGYALKGSGHMAWFYGVLFLSVLPFVWLASTTQPFQAFYPQFKGVFLQDGAGGVEVLWQHVVIFELIYGLLFLSGESFWRGYIVFGLEEELGDYGILFMIVPYVMSHYEKPFGETMGAIVSGFVLGYLALRHRNFWLGVLVHWGVAVSMDLLALHQLGVSIVW